MRPPSRAKAAGDAAHSEARRLLRQVLEDPSSLPTRRPAEIDLALRLARRVRLLGRIACMIDDPSRLPVEARDQLESARVLAEANGGLALWELNRVESALYGTPLKHFVVLKGCAYALQGLPNAEGRHFADLDLLVDHNDLPKVERLLLEHGWASSKDSDYDQYYYREWAHELPPLVHSNRDVEVDLHHNVLPRTARIKVDIDKILRRVERIPGTRVERLCDVDMVLHAIVHLFFDSEMDNRLRDLVDIDVLLRHFSSRSDTFADALVKRGAELGLERPVFYALRYAERLLGTPLPQAAVAAATAGAPNRWVLALMDALVERALFPEHPDVPSPMSRVSRFLLYLRSHWIRMPPLLLARHLSYKAALGVRSALFGPPGRSTPREVPQVPGGLADAETTRRPAP